MSNEYVYFAFALNDCIVCTMKKEVTVVFFFGGMWVLESNIV